MIRDDFPSGYHGCCGMARARGHHVLCEAAQAIEARRVETETGSIGTTKARPEGCAKDDTA